MQRVTLVLIGLLLVVGNRKEEKMEKITNKIGGNSNGYNSETKKYCYYNRIS